jgi:hypothetical protein
MKFLRRAFATIAAIAFAGGAAAAAERAAATDQLAAPNDVTAANDRVAAANDRVAAANDRVAAMAGAFAPYVVPPQPSMYSFADVYRLTVVGGASADNPLAALAGASDVASARLPKSDAAPDYQLRVVSSEPQPAVRQMFPAATAAPVQASYMFSIGAMPQPERWLLILSGLAAAAWVARRRLGNSF